MRHRNLVAVQFANWWAEARCDNPYWDWGLGPSFRWWWEPRQMELTEEMEEDILDELEARGMIYTDPMQYFDAEEDAA